MLQEHWWRRLAFPIAFYAASPGARLSLADRHYLQYFTAGA